jgi:KDO2-lipid IV(A) lauroyltransferase
VARYYLLPKALAERFPALERLALAFEARLFRGLFRLLQWLPPATAVRVAGGCFALLGVWTDKARKAQRNLAIAFPEHDRRWRRRTVRGIFRALGESAAELAILERIWRDREQRLKFELAPGAQSHISRRDAAVYVCAHVGAWQLTNLIAREYGLTISTVYAEESNPAMGELMHELRQAFGVKLVPSKAGVRPLLRELGSGHSVGLAADTRVDSGQPVPFFGHDALTSTSAARLALRTGAVVLPVRCERLGGACYRIVVEDPLRPADPQSPVEEQTLELTRQMNARFETWIRQAPDQWICLKRRWPKALNAAAGNR